jgi:membrane-associated HD superfamily phosphohydrolase
VEKIRELSILLQTGIEEYEEQQKLLQQERLKYMRLSFTNGFGNTEDTSQESWLVHLKDMEETLNIRRSTMRQAIKNAAAEIVRQEQAEQAAANKSAAEGKE